MHVREARNAKLKTGPESKKPRSQIAGRDYGHSSVCQSCWDGGEIVCCDLCPVSAHPLHRHHHEGHHSLPQMVVPASLVP